MTRAVKRVKPRDTKNLHLVAQIAGKRLFKTRKGETNRRILMDVRLGNHDYILHATKGFRRRRRFGEI